MAESRPIEVRKGSGVYDESSLGAVFFLWSSVFALFTLVLPSLAVMGYLMATRKREPKVQP